MVKVRADITLGKKYEKGEGKKVKWERKRKKGKIQVKIGKKAKGANLKTKVMNGE
jgi:hypothetical protein